VFFLCAQTAQQPHNRANQQQQPLQTVSWISSATHSNTLAQDRSQCVCCTTGSYALVVTCCNVLTVRFLDQQPSKRCNEGSAVYKKQNHKQQNNMLTTGESRGKAFALCSRSKESSFFAVLLLCATQIGNQLTGSA
jgi:hypothetical protein